MKALIQRVRRASVTVDGQVTGEIAHGLLVLLGITHGDGPDQITWLAKKLVNLRIFSDDEGKMNLSLLDVQGGCLVVSQFTLYGDTRKGNRPSYVNAARPEQAEPLYEEFVRAVSAHGITTATGIFGAMMDVELINDGPVTLMVETP